jgi:nucleoside-diphosphate-sugar epimerase
MFYNLYYNKHCFDKFIHFGSGAELNTPSNPYGLSKKIINDLIKSEHGFFNIRIFGVFDENELNTRFIKSSILKYLNKTPITIHQDKYMDFYYMGDLINLVHEYVIGNPYTSLPKISECSYRKKYKLSDIASFINTLGNYKVPINIVDSAKGDSYIGTTVFNMITIGLEQGIINTYNKLK